MLTTLKRRSLWLALIFFMALALFIWMATLAMTSHQDAFDQRVLEFRTSVVTPSVVQFMKMITFFGDRKFLLPIYAVVTLILLIQQRYAYGLMVPIAGIGAAFIEAFFKESLQRVRPDFPEIARLTGYSFPSGHAVSSVVFYILVMILTWNSKLNRTIKWAITILFIIFILLIGASRVVLNVHYASDVIGGFAIGAAWVLLCYIMMHVLYGKLYNKL